MNSMFFDENGFFSLDEVVMQMSSFQKIMEDGIVTNEELKSQSEHVMSLLHQIENNSSPQQITEIKELLAEMSVLFAVYHYKELQSLH